MTSSSSDSDRAPDYGTASSLLLTRDTAGRRRGPDSVSGGRKELGVWPPKTRNTATQRIWGRYMVGLGGGQ